MLRIKPLKYPLFPAIISHYKDGYPKFRFKSKQQAIRFYYAKGGLKEIYWYIHRELFRKSKYKLMYKGNTLVEIK